MKPIAILFSSLLMMAACRQADHESQSTTTPAETTATSTNPSASTTNSGSNLMKESHYDASAINPTAEVVTIKLKTTGNSMDEMKYDQTEIHVKEGTTVKLS